MLVEHVMKKNPVTISSDEPIQEAAKQMKKHNIGALMVMEDGGLGGIVTDRDIALALASESSDPKAMPVSDVMTEDPVTADVSIDIESALRLMEEEKIRRLPVMDEGKLVGVVSSADLAAAMKEQIDRFLNIEEVYAKY